MKLAGVILLAAGAAKIWELLTEPSLGAGFIDSRLVESASAAAEVGLALWIFSGIFKRTAWLVTMGSFVVFLGLTLHRAFIGAESCGCFGNVEVDPWVTIFAVIVPVLGLLLFCRNKEWKWFGMGSFRYFIVWLALGMTIVLGTFGYLMANEPPEETQNYAVLQPENWQGETFGLLDQIDIGEFLAEGKWVVLLYRHDCEVCHEAMKEYGDISYTLDELAGRPAVALIEMPPYEDKDIPMVGSFIEGKLADTKDWYVTTPVIVVLEDGNVVFSSEGIVPEEETLLSFFQI